VLPRFDARERRRSPSSRRLCRLDQAFELQWGARLPADNEMIKARSFIVGVATLMITMSGAIPDEDERWIFLLLEWGETDPRALQFAHCASDHAVRELIQEVSRSGTRVMEAEAC
jgi:hypothetical protein